MIVARDKQSLRGELRLPRREGRRIGLVPTMGSLHEGHVSLLEEARTECDLVVMSLFVNPAQFGPDEDLEAYPRDESRDLELAERAGVDLVYCPDPGEVYPEGFATTVGVSGLTEVLEGDRGGRGRRHFDGVTTVVAKLLNTVGPDVAYFGRKDAQQAAVIRRMVADLDFPVEIAVLPTVREADGLAMSSRNAYLDDRERALAASIPRSLEAVRAAAGEDSGPDRLERALAAGRDVLRSAGVEPEYLEARDPDDLGPIEDGEAIGERPILVAVAARIGPARLIDNLTIEPKKERA